MDDDDVAAALLSVFVQEDLLPLLRLGGGAAGAHLPPRSGSGSGLGSPVAQVPPATLQLQQSVVELPLGAECGFVSDDQDDGNELVGPAAPDDAYCAPPSIASVSPPAAVLIDRGVAADGGQLEVLLRLSDPLPGSGSTEGLQLLARFRNEFVPTRLEAGGDDMEVKVGYLRVDN